jgi:hypothetical protein
LCSPFVIRNLWTKIWISKHADLGTETS